MLSIHMVLMEVTLRNFITVYNSSIFFSEIAVSICKKIDLNISFNTKYAQAEICPNIFNGNDVPLKAIWFSFLSAAVNLIQKSNGIVAANKSTNKEK